MAKISQSVCAALFLSFFVACTPLVDEEAAGQRDGGGRDASLPGVIVIEGGSPEGGSGGTRGDSSVGDAGGGEAGSAGTCTVTVEEHALQEAIHVAVPLAAEDYNSSPPSSGSHCDQWGAYATYAEPRPLPACYFMHNLEHAGVALLYNCPDGCPEIAAALEQVKLDAPADPDCAAKRILITPYQEMDATIAASAWGFTWTSNCTELGATARSSLLDFIAARLGSNGISPEPEVCSDGSISP